MASAKGQRQAAGYNAGLFAQNQYDTWDALGDYSNRAINTVNNGLTSTTNALRDNSNLALTSLGTGAATARNDITTNYGQARNDLQAGVDTFNPWVNNGVAASNAQNDFLGLNGAGASGAQATALNNWRQGTGYQDVVDQTSDAALRKASVIGGLGGNQIDAVARIGGNLANQTSQQYFGNLGSVSQTGLSAAGQQQSGLTNMANLGVQQGNSLAGIATDLGSKEAGIYTGLGSALGNAYTDAGKSNASIYTGMGNSLAQLGQYTTTGTTGGIMQAGQASDAAKNANQQTAINLGTTAFKAVLGMPSFGGGGLTPGTGGLY